MTMMTRIPLQQSLQQVPVHLRRADHPSKVERGRFKPSSLGCCFNSTDQEICDLHAKGLDLGMHLAGIDGGFN
ncbi:hypothetical protein MKK64_10145 [Methylobacterium sp. E-025]|uniref:hypothetical protein n=1 Tax=Methylobacterium sp. E-025 TaxID=2836561 RepID=UPI001FB8B5AA|nr:hypothetical protein [Methylobacterium sp. E-025]MCJ2111553.1 hypothetical protein [Methylobacterium sp. E-025]